MNLIRVLSQGSQHFPAMKSGHTCAPLPISIRLKLCIDEFGKNYSFNLFIQLQQYPSTIWTQVIVSALFHSKPNPINPVCLWDHIQNAGCSGASGVAWALVYKDIEMLCGHISLRKHVLALTLPTILEVVGRNWQNDKFKVERKYRHLEQSLN